MLVDVSVNPLSFQGESYSGPGFISFHYKIQDRKW